MLLFVLMSLDSGDRQKLYSLYLRYRQPMFRAACDILNDDGYAEDAVHTAFVNISGHLSKFTVFKPFATKAYLLKTVKNVALKMYNQNKHISGAEDFCSLEYKISDGKSLEQQVINKISFESIEKCLSNMAPKHRDILIFRYYYGMNYEQIAVNIGITAASARKRLERARKEFILKYGGDIGEE